MSDAEAMKYTQHKALLPVPDLEGVTHRKGTDLTEKQEASLQTVLDHFSKPDYGLPEVEDGKLSDEEKYWLVCSLQCFIVTRLAGTEKFMVFSKVVRVFAEVGYFCTCEVSGIYSLTLL